MVTLTDIEMDKIVMGALVDQYKAQQSEVAEAQGKLDTLKEQIKQYLGELELTTFEVDDYVVKLIEVNRETIDTKIAKVVIPKKYLPQILKVSSYRQLRIDRKKESQVSGG